MSINVRQVKVKVPLVCLGTAGVSPRRDGRYIGFTLVSSLRLFLLSLIFVLIVIGFVPNRRPPPTEKPYFTVQMIADPHTKAGKQICSKVRHGLDRMRYSKNYFWYNCPFLQEISAML